jgi:molybdopterin-containing oxidoreductase family membrane subunit
MSLLWGYFTVAEHLTIWYGKQPAEYAVFEARIYGRFAPYFWTMVAFNLFVPLILLGIRRLRSIRTVILCGFTVMIGMWLERFLIVVNTLSYPRLASAWGRYAPTWVEISITAGTFAGMVLAYLIFAKIFPVIAIWEYEEDVAHG